MKILLTINDYNVNLIRGWIKDREGVAVWNSINLSNLDGQWLSPASTNGKQTNKPNWQCKNEPVIIKDEKAIEVVTALEVKRFHIAIRQSGNGLAIKLTDGSTNKVKKAVEQAGKGAWYEFDYEEQEAIILKPDSKVLLSEYKAGVKLPGLVSGHR